MPENGQSNQGEVCPPPGAGRNLFKNGTIAENLVFCGTSRDPVETSPRQVTAERDANTPQSDGDYTGNGVFASFLVAALLLAAVAIIALAQHEIHSLRLSHVCIKPTAIPATWFGDCAARFGGGQR